MEKQNKTQLTNEFNPVERWQQKRTRTKISPKQHGEGERKVKTAIYESSRIFMFFTGSRNRIF